MRVRIEKERKMARRGDKVHIIATGNQAPYGIGETIAIFPMGHRRRIQAELDQWYSKPDVEIHRGGMLLVRVRGLGLAAVCSWYA